MGMGGTSGMASTSSIKAPPQTYMSNTNTSQGFGASGYGNQYGASQSQFSHIDETTTRGRQQAKVRRLIEQGKRLAEYERKKKEEAELNLKLKPKVSADGKKKGKSSKDT